MAAEEQYLRICKKLHSIELLLQKIIVNVFMQITTIIKIIKSSSDVKAAI